ncbi:MAG: hypothetical protein SGARI_002067 [Bacillariaceae sp.]
MSSSLLHRQHPTSQKPSSCLLLSKQNKDNNESGPSHFAGDDVDILRERLFSLHLQILEEELARPPNANLGPIEVVTAIMEGLLDAYDPLPDSGFRLLLHSSTPKWRREILRSVGVPMDDDNDVEKERKNDVNIKKKRKKLKTINARRRRPTKKEIDYELFAILVGEGEDYVLDFSASESQLLDYGDGSCWVECRLRDKHTDELLVLTGWDLVQREDDGAWLVDWIYWQDFRELFRPGIGREEWMLER